MVAIDVHSREKKILWKSMATVIRQNIFLCVQQKKETHTGLQNSYKISKVCTKKKRMLNLNVIIGEI